MINNRKNILYVGGFELPDKNAAAHRVSIVGKLLRRSGFSVYYLGITHSVALKEVTADFYLENTPSDNKWNITYPQNLREWIKYSSSIKIIEKIIKNYFKEKPVAIIAYNYPSIALFKLKQFCKSNNIAILADSTEWSNYSENLFLRIIKPIDTFIRMRIIHKSLDGIITISGFLFNYYNSKQKNILLLPPLVDKSDIKWRSSPTPNNNSSIKIIYAGSAGGKQKDRLDLIIESLSKVKTQKSFHLLVVGITKEQFLAKYGIKSIPLTIKNKIYFLGKLSHVETIKLIMESDYSIFLRDKNYANNAGFPTKFVESIACGTPVLTNSTSDLNNYFINGTLGVLLNSENKTELVSSLKKAIDLPKSEIKQIKKQCSGFNLFHYEIYESSFRAFIGNVIN